MSNSSDREQAREQLRKTVDALAHQADLYGKMQKEPLKMIGGASGVGLILGVLLGRRGKRTQTVYVDAYANKRDQKALIKAQRRAVRGKAGGLGGALFAAATTIAVRIIGERFMKPQLEQLANQLLEQKEQRQTEDFQRTR